VAKSKTVDEVSRTAVRVLTRSRAIDGTFVSSKTGLSTSWGAQWVSDSSTFFYLLEDATVTTFGGVAGSVAGPVAVAAGQILAALVRDPSAAQATAEEYAKFLKVSVAATLHAGPFVCTGTVMLPSDPFEKAGNKVNLLGRIFPVRQATIRCLDAALGVPDETSELVLMHATGLEALSLSR
jgi:hypothetical protein